MNRVLFSRKTFRFTAKLHQSRSNIPVRFSLTIFQSQLGIQRAFVTDDITVHFANCMEKNKNVKSDADSLSEIEAMLQEV